MNRLAQLAVFAGIILAGLCLAQELIPTTPPPEKTAAEKIADSIVETLNGEIKHRVEVHKQLVDVLWHDERATPDAILAALGTKAKLLFQVSAANKAHLTTLAALVGKSIDDFLPAEYQTPPLAFTIHNDGTVTIDR